MQVCVIKLPVEIVQDQLGEILEGILLWSQDSKNKFRLKVGWHFSSRDSHSLWGLSILPFLESTLTHDNSSNC